MTTFTIHSESWLLPSPELTFILNTYFFKRLYRRHSSIFFRLIIDTVSFVFSSPQWIPERSNLSGERFVLSHDFQGFIFSDRLWQSSITNIMSGRRRKEGERGEWVYVLWVFKFLSFILPLSNLCDGVFYIQLRSLLSESSLDSLTGILRAMLY